MFNQNPYFHRGPPFPYQQPNQPFPHPAFGLAQPPLPGPYPQYPQPGFPQFQPQSQGYGPPPLPLQQPNFGQTPLLPPQLGFGQPQQYQYSQSGQILPHTPIATSHLQPPPIAPPPPPPSQYSQVGEAQQLQQNTPAVSTEAHVLVRRMLPIAPGQLVPPQYPEFEQLLPTAYQHNGLPVYGPAPPSLPRKQSQQSLNEIPRVLVPNRVSFSRPSTLGLGMAPGPRRSEVIFHMLRHAHAGSLHTFDAQYIEERFQDIGNPGLSPLGSDQCRNLKKALSGNTDVYYVLSSPMSRAMATARFIFPDWDQRKTNLIAWDKLRDCPPASNRYKFNTKSGEGLESLKRWQGKPFDLTLVNEGWQRDFAEMNSQSERAEVVRAELFKLEDVAITGGMWNGVRFDRFTGAGNVHIVVLSHNNFLNFLTHRHTSPGKRDLKTFIQSS